MPRPLTRTLIISLALAAGMFIVERRVASAAVPVEVRVFNPQGERQQAWELRPRVFQSGAEVAVADIDGDGQTDFIVAPAPGQPAQLTVFTSEGVARRTFPVLDGKFRGGLNLDTGDLDADGVTDIIVSARAGGGPRVEVYRGSGERLVGFAAYQRDFRGGVDAGIGDLNDDGRPEVVTISGYESPGHVRVFSSQGASRTLTLFPFGRQSTFGGSLAVGDVDPEVPGDEIVVVPLGPARPTVSVYTGRGERLHHFLVSGPDAQQGLTVATANLDDDPADEIAIASRHGKPQLQLFDANGRRVGTFPVFATSFRGDLAISAGPNRTVTVAPQPRRTEGRTDLPRYIEIDLSEQKLRYWRLGEKVGEERISTGKWSTPTPIGQFKTYNKARLAYSRRYKLYMAYWMAITSNGLYGIHELPHWRFKDGTIKYEGEDHLGTPVSHGCIRLSRGGAKKLYDWAPVGTPVIIQP